METEAPGLCRKECQRVEGILEYLTDYWPAHEFEEIISGLRKNHFNKLDVIVPWCTQT